MALPINRSRSGSGLHGCFSTRVASARGPNHSSHCGLLTPKAEAIDLLQQFYKRGNPRTAAAGKAAAAAAAGAAGKEAAAAPK